MQRLQTLVFNEVNMSEESWQQLFISLTDTRQSPVHVKLQYTDADNGKEELVMSYPSFTLLGDPWRVGTRGKYWSLEFTTSCQLKQREDKDE